MVSKINGSEGWIGGNGGLPKMSRKADIIMGVLIWSAYIVFFGLMVL